MTDIPDSYVEAVRGNVCPTVEEQIKADCTAAIADLESRLAATRDEIARSYERAGHGAPVPDDLREVVADALYEVIGHDAYDCTRDWTAWSCGTMRPGDFAEVADRVDEIRDHVLSALAAAGYVVVRPPQAGDGLGNGLVAVPMEPTASMWSRGSEPLERWVKEPGYAGKNDAAVLCYRAMLSAAKDNQDD